ncbi:hypothetical protein A2U01_0055807, partial [Trifolium medium]|nr:hypothetical protein [Trifolium medium]
GECGASATAWHSDSSTIS